MTQAYDAFGLASDGAYQEGRAVTYENPFGYNGQYTDWDCGLIYLRNRYYDPESGTFLTEDPYWNVNNMIYGDDPENTTPDISAIMQSGNLYAYCGSDPVNNWDPSGLSVWSDLNDFNLARKQYGVKIAKQIYDYANLSSSMAKTYSENHGMGGEVWNNEADAYRHFMWNAMMTRHVGYEEAKFAGNVHEISGLEEKGFLNVSPGFSTLNSTIISAKMNQETLMDLWNNQVGRELANNPNLMNYNGDQLFKVALNLGILITDANNVFDFLGISDYITDTNTWTVDVLWNTETGNITVYKDGYQNLDIKIGI